MKVKPTARYIRTAVRDGRRRGESTRPPAPEVVGYHEAGASWLCKVGYGCLCHDANAPHPDGDA